MATWFWRHQCKPHTTCSTPCTRCASPGAAQVDKKTLTLAPWISSTGPAPARTGIRNSNVSRWIYGQPQDFQLPAVRDRLLTLRCWRSGQLDEGRLRVGTCRTSKLKSAGGYLLQTSHSLPRTRFHCGTDSHSLADSLRRRDGYDSGLSVSDTPGLAAAPHSNPVSSGVNGDSLCRLA